jgi:peptidyl-prolyl cis-trans isomerase SurA
MEVYKMHARMFSLAVLVSSAFVLSSCATEHSKIVLSEFGNEKITMGEFEKTYIKNAGSPEIAKKDSVGKYKNFLDLYTNFKMKLNDAYSRGYDKDAQLAAELADYKKRVGASYLVEKKLTEPGIEKLYDMRKYELRVSHIMIRKDSLSEEKTAAFAASLLERIKKGEKYEDICKKYSSDKFSSNTGGDLYYITGGNLIQELEDAAYKTPVGQVYPEVVKTRFGYHIIKVTDKRERIASIRASHILLDFKNDSGKVDSTAALAKIRDIKARLDKGEDFAELAKKYSKDPGSKELGGDLGFFERRQMVKEFDEAAFKLNVGQVSDVVKTNYGYHLIKLTEKKGNPALEEDKELLKKLYKRSRYDAENAKFMDTLKSEFKFAVNKNTLDYIVKNCDSTKFGNSYWISKWRDQVKNNEIYSINGASVSVDTFFNKIQNYNEFNGKPINEKLMTSAISKASEGELLDEAALTLDKKDLQFAALMEDYKNGIYIFKLQEDEVWNKIKIDSSKLVEHFEKTKDNYLWPDRVAYSEIFSRKDSLINNYYALLKKGENFDSLAAKYTERPGLKEKAGKYDLCDLTNAIAQKAYELKNTGDFTEPFTNGNGSVIVKLNEKSPSHKKTFEEAKAEVSGAVQEMESKRLEDEYINSLKTKYNPVIHYDKVDQIFK